MRNYKGLFVRIGGTSLLAGALALSLTGCGTSASTEETSREQVVIEASADDASATDEAAATTGETATTTQATAEAEASVAVAEADDTAASESDLFTTRDLAQVADTEDATKITLTSGEDVQITQEGVYVLSGEATDVTITIEATDSDKVQLVLNGVSITNGDFPTIYVKSADKVFVTTAEGTTNTLQVTGTFAADGETNTDAVIFSRDDLVLNGLGTLQVSSTDNGISCKDDLKVTGGSYVISSAADALEANDSILVADGSFSITSDKDGLHAENDEDDTQGSIYIQNGSFEIKAASDAIQATTTLTVDGGTFAISAAEALEATIVQVNGGDMDIYATDDAINGSYKSASVGTPTVEITGGSMAIEMAQGDTDAIDVNGNLVISGGQIDITAQSAFDFDGTVSFTGGTVTVNGTQLSEITNSMMGGGMGGGMRGQMGGDMGEPMGGPMGGGHGGPMSGDAGIQG